MLKIVCEKNYWRNNRNIFALIGKIYCDLMDVKVFSETKPIRVEFALQYHMFLPEKMNVCGLEFRDPKTNKVIYG